MNVVRALVGIDRFEILRMAHDMVTDLDPIAAVHVAGDAGNIQRLSAIVALDEADHLGRYLAFVEETANAQRGLQAERYLGLHVGEFLLE